MDLEQEQWVTQLEKEKDSIILDVRTPEEFHEGHIPGAVNIDIYLGQVFLDEIKKQDTHKKYYIYCKSGGRSAQACTLMKQLGFNTTYNLLGGYSKWKGKIIS